MSTGERTDSGLRQIAAPVVVTPAKGVPTSARVRPTASETASLERIGVFLGALNRQALASRVRLGRVAGHQQAGWRAAEKRRLTALSSSLWAGALTRTAIDSYHMGMRALSAEAASLHAAIEMIGSRLNAP